MIDKPTPFNREYNREYRDNGKENGNYYSIRGYLIRTVIGIQHTPAITLEISVV